MLLEINCFVWAQIQDPGVTNAEEILEGALGASRLVVESFSKDWQDFADGNSEVYTAVVQISLLLATALIGFWVIGWYKEIAEYSFSPRVLNEMVYPILVILLLMNNGALLASTSLACRNTAVYVNDSILNITRNGVTLREAIRRASLDSAFAAAATAKIEQCQALPTSEINEDGETISPRTKCIEQATQSVKDEADQFREKLGLPGLPNTLNPLEIVGEILNSAVQGILYLFLGGLQASFQYLIQVSFLINAYIGPIFLVLSMLPFGNKPIFAWFSGWLGLGLILISYSIIVGIAASSIVNTPATNPLFLQLIQGLLSPLLAIAVGMYGGASIFRGFTSAASFLVFRRL